MATIRMSAYAISSMNPWGPTINLHLGGPNPIPTRSVEATKREDVNTAYAAYVEEARATGKPMQLSAFVSLGRKPAGFDAWKESSMVNVNV